MFFLTLRLAMDAVSKVASISSFSAAEEGFFFNLGGKHRRIVPFIRTHTHTHRDLIYGNRKQTVQSV